MGGMVDVVNTYLGIGLANGLVGLGCFAGAFAYVTFAVLRSMWRLPDHNDEQHTLGSGLLACLVGVMVTIFTVSSISFIPVVYWTVLGLGAGYAGLRAPAMAGGVAEPIDGRFSLRAGQAQPSRARSAA